jgi:hypothetical protein
MDIDPKIYAECLQEERERYERLVHKTLDRDERLRNQTNGLSFVAGAAIGVALVLGVGAVMNYRGKRPNSTE